MKSYEFELDSLMVNKISEPIRTKLDIIILLINTIQYILWKPLLTDKECQLKIVIKKMKRIFYFQNNKIFSITMPFLIKEDNGQISIVDNDDSELNIDNKLLAMLLSIFEESVKNEKWLLDILDERYVEDEITEWERENLLYIIYRLLLTEYGYLRYDDDIEHENGKLHPRYHLDVNASSNATFKVGLDESIDLEHFIDILDITTQCAYLK